MVVEEELDVAESVEKSVVFALSGRFRPVVRQLRRVEKGDGKAGGTRLMVGEDDNEEDGDDGDDDEDDARY